MSHAAGCLRTYKLRVKCEHTGLIAAYEEERRQPSAQTLQPGHVQWRTDNVFTRHRQCHYNQIGIHGIFDQMLAQPQIPIGFVFDCQQISIANRHCKQQWKHRIKPHSSQSHNM